MINFNFCKRKDTLLRGYLASFKPETCKDILEIANQSVIEGNSKIVKLEQSEPNLFGRRTLKSILLNNAIIDIFRTKVLANEKTKHRVKFFETYRMTFALVDNSFFLCFKALGKENLIEGMKTKRFEDIIEGKPFAMSKRMRAELSKLNLKSFPPILFVGFKKANAYIDFVNLQHYFEGNLALEYGIRYHADESSNSKFKPKNKDSEGESSSEAV